MKIILTKQCKKELELLQKSVPKYAKLVILKIQQIAKDGFHHDSIKGYEGLFKSRVGGLRIGYSFNQDEVIFWMVKKRGEAYRKSNLSNMRGVIK